MPGVSARTSSLAVRTLTDGGQTAEEVAEEVIAFIDAARRSLDLALYSVRLPGEVGDRTAHAIRAAARRGVAVRILYNEPEGEHRSRVSPPPATRPELLRGLDVPLRAIPGEEDLMHHKFVVRDRTAVWCGSANWTIDSWARQENVVVTVVNPQIAAAYEHDFNELWRSRQIEGTGETVIREVELGGGRTARPWFAPGRGEQLSHRIATAIGRARHRVRIASPVMTAGPILGTLAEVTAEGRLDLTGVCDATQTEDVLRQWAADGPSRWKIPILEQVLRDGGFTGKRSEPWGADGVHDVMHAKVVVADDLVFVGSFNLSRSGERNAENVLELRDPELADRLAGWIDGLRERYAEPVVGPH